MATAKKTRKTTKEREAKTKIAIEAKGRPGTYMAEYHPEQARKYCLLGCTDERLAELLDVSESTLNRWKEEHKEFRESIYEGRDKADANIANSLYHRALGYSHPEDDIKAVAKGANMGSSIVITPTIRHYPPDTTAASLWLRNRQPKRWMDKQDVNLTGSVEMTSAEVDAKLAALIAKLGAAST
jgi:hypothetical protein